MAAAREVFAARGFDGATLKLIADRANTTVPLIVYHFKSKLDLWHAAVEDVMRTMDRTRYAILERADLPAADRFMRLVEIVVGRHASMPEMHRVVVMEAYSESSRLTWLLDNFVRRIHVTFVQLIREGQGDRSIRDFDPEMLRYMILGVAALPSFAAEYRMLTGREPRDPQEIERAIAFIAKAALTDAAFRRWMNRRK